MLGEPTGLNLKYWLSGTRAAQFGLTYSFGNYLGILGDYLFHFKTALSKMSGGSISSEFVPYVGVGGELFFNTASYAPPGNHFFEGSTGTNSSALGIRIPLGVEFLPRELPVGISLEIVPGVGVIPTFFGFFQADVSVRYYF